MYHTFSTTALRQDAESSKSAKEQASRRPLAVRACEPCRRRKVKCSGDLPCETCRWYRKSAQCHYVEHSQRMTSTRRPSDKVNLSLINQYRIVHQKLFPNLTPEQVSELSREELIDLVTKDSPRRITHSESPLMHAGEEVRPHLHPDADSLETFQPIPEEGSEVSDQQPSKALQGVQDDVNALSLSVKPTSSYLGISSVMAVLRIIVWLDPEAQTVFRRTPEGSIVSSREVTSPSTPAEAEDPSLHTDGPASSAWDEIPQINSFFTFFHPMVPLLNEQSFRDTYITRSRSDRRWLLLLNIVLALGSAVNGTASDTGHRLYYIRAQRYLNLETFGLVHLETVQALALLSGYYLHYLQLPNQANSMMGATLRMATALGLHRDYSESVVLSKKEKLIASVELRRRIWWCIFCLDSWASISLGRPSMGRMNHAVTAKPPQQLIGSSTQILTLLQENIQFALISTKQEDILAYSPIIDESERKVLDDAYLDWFKASSAHDNTPKPSTTEAIGISVMRSIMRWRYLWCRTVLHRPVLLWYAMRKTPFSKLSAERQATIELCRELTGELINGIASSWAGRNRCIMSAWHATWLLYQATMVPLLSLFSDCSNSNVLKKSHTQIQTSMRVLSDQVDYAHTAKRSLEVITLIYEAGRKYCSKKTPDIRDLQITEIGVATSSNPTTHSLPPNIVDSPAASQLGFPDGQNTPYQEMIMDNMFDSLNWSTGWTDGSEDFVDYNRLGNSFDYIETGLPGAQQFVPVSDFELTFPFDSAGSEHMDMQQ